MNTMTKPRLSSASVSRAPYSTTSRSKSVSTRDDAAANGSWFVILLGILFGAGFLAIAAITYILLLG